MTQRLAKTVGRRTWRSTRSVLSIAVLCALAVALGPALAGRGVLAQAQAEVRLDGPSKVSRDADPFQISVKVDDVENLGAFEVEITYDPTVLDAQEVERGPFLGSSGRTVSCIDPRLEPGHLRFVCVTLGPEPPGADGSGVLATIEFEPKGEGTSPVELSHAALANPEGTLIPSATEGASVTVAAGAGGSGPGWSLWGALIGAGGVAAVVLGFGWWRFRRRAAGA